MRLDGERDGEFLDRRRHADEETASAEASTVRTE